MSFCRYCGKEETAGSCTCKQTIKNITQGNTEQAATLETPIHITSSAANSFFKDFYKLATTVLKSPGNSKAAIQKYYSNNIGILITALSAVIYGLFYIWGLDKAETFFNVLGNIFGGTIPLYFKNFDGYFLNYAFCNVVGIAVLVMLIFLAFKNKGVANIGEALKVVSLAQIPVIISMLIGLIFLEISYQIAFVILILGVLYNFGFTYLFITDLYRADKSYSLYVTAITTFISIATTFYFTAKVFGKMIMKVY